MLAEERVDRELRAAFSALPALDPDPDLAVLRRLDGARVAAALAAAEPDSRALVSDVRIAGPAGPGTLRVRLYRPAGEGPDPGAGLLWMHGGGFALGSPETDEGFCRRVAAEAGCTVASVDYRLAPEHPFPAALEDCHAALVWLAGAVGAGRLAVGGASAGGGLAAGVALLARDRGRGGPGIDFQFLKYPCLDDRHQTASSHQILDPRLWNRERSLRAWRDYLGPEREGVSEYAAPARSSDLARLPPAYIYAAELDLLRDEDLEYARRLREAGVGVELRVAWGTFHGSDGLAPAAAVSRRNQDEFVAVIQRALHPSDVTL